MTRRGKHLRASGGLGGWWIVCGRAGRWVMCEDRLVGIQRTEFETRYRDRLASVSGLFLGDTLVTCVPAEAPGTCSSKTRALRRSPNDAG